MRQGSGDWVCGGVEFGLGVSEMGRNGGWVHERDGGGAELGMGRDDFDAAAEDGGVGLDGRGHVEVEWKCW